MNIFMLLAILAILVGFALQTVSVTWPRFQPGWAALFLAALLYLLRFLGAL